MKMTNMKTVMKKLMYPLLVGGLLWSGEALAQSSGDIVSIKSDFANQEFTSSGQNIDFKITLAGYFVLTNAFNATEALKPELRMIVNGTVAYATFRSLSQYQLVGAYPRTDAIFSYRVKPGDMAQPMLIYGSETPPVPYQLFYNSWAFRSATNLNADAVWVLDPNKAYPAFGETFDLTLAKANIRIKTLELQGVTSLPATETALWRVSSVNPTESAGVSVYVWTPGTNILQIGSTPNQTWDLVNIPTNTSFKDFPIRGLAVGTTDVYLQRPVDYANNFTTVGVTNYIKRQITISTPPLPTIRLLMTEAGEQSATVNETATANAGRFRVELSESYTNDLYVRIDTTPLGQSNVTFATQPVYVQIPALSTLSGYFNFNAPDGTALSASPGVELTPVLTNALAASKYQRVVKGTVYVTNAKPALIQPTAAYNPTAVMNAPFTFNWTATDVPADTAAGMTVTWNFGDGTTTNVPGSAGSVPHTFPGAANSYDAQVTVYATDKDGASSDPVLFTVKVQVPVPKPFVSVSVNPNRYDETNDLGRLTVTLSQATFPGGGDVYVRLNTDPAAQQNFVFATNVIKITSGTNASDVQEFTLIDGTIASSAFGVTLIPEIINNAAAAAFFTDLRSSSVFVKNVRPQVTRPAAGSLVLPSLPPFDKVPMATPFVFDYTVKDVTADLSTMIVRWRFGDGVSAVVTGAVGQVTHAYTSLGDKYVWLQAQDKDGGFSDEIEFKITVVSPPPPPTVRILSPADATRETRQLNTGLFTVQLSEAFTEKVTVRLTTSPVNNNSNGRIVLQTNQVEFAVGQTEKEVKFSALDGTDNSWITGFTIIPQVTGSAAAITKFANIETGTVEIMNVDPVINLPLASDLLGLPVASYAQGVSVPFSWNISDVTNDYPTMRVLWNFGDNTPIQSGLGQTGTVYHTFNEVGLKIIEMEAWDKDNGYAVVRYKITVSPSKTVMVTPVGPNDADYYGAKYKSGTSDATSPIAPALTGAGGGLGYGIVLSENARSSRNRNDVYTFAFNPTESTAVLEARPYKANTGSYYVTRYWTNSEPYYVGQENFQTNKLAKAIRQDSFFFTWFGTDQGIATTDQTPLAPATVVMGLPAAAADGTQAAEVRSVRAIFSLEWDATDNVGDINCDGIPDDTAQWILSEIGGADVAAGEGTPAWMQTLTHYNDDLDTDGTTVVGDFLPYDPYGALGTFDFRPTGTPFTAFYEVRGMHLALNRVDISIPTGVEDEPYTNPTVADTDNDGFPDGWEYFFWRAAKFGPVGAPGVFLVGSAYNPYDVSVGTVIPSSKIEIDFHPTQPNVAASRDTDNDGLLDIEELSIGTNPIHWDTDGDGICDGWEVMRGMNPTDPGDANSNPDGDYMAYREVRMNLVTLSDGSLCVVPAESAVIIGNALGYSQNVNRVYHYGDSNAVFAAGLPVKNLASEIVADVATNTTVAWIHFQVNHKFGFDPRTAWIGTMNYHAAFKRFPDWVAGAPDTRAFTSLDEYLLLKFMSENLLNDASETMSPRAGTWGSFSTHPNTPDSDFDVVNYQNDGMPDGWELYVAIEPGRDLTVAANRSMMITPWSWGDGTGDRYPGENAPPRDGLNNRREFAGTESIAAYTNSALYNMSNALARVSIVRPAGDVNWLNKFWPTDPWRPDTDGDGLSDSAEQTFVYGPPTDNSLPLIQGGGLNPNAIDTDLDFLPDKWEVEFAGTIPGDGTYSGIVITNGMDGTVVDSEPDCDFDGLKNFQEYWVQAVRSFRYDIPLWDGTGLQTVGVITENLGWPMDTSFAPAMLFTPITNLWDLSMFPWGTQQPNLWVMLAVGNSKLYVSTDPRNPDTDFDSMDDFYELFHGLNPILGLSTSADRLDDRVKRAYVANNQPTIWPDYNDFSPTNSAGIPIALLPMDFVSYPWLTGMPEADPDADGLLNLEEQILVNQSAPPNHNTDPTPLWLTDGANPSSVSRRFYQPYAMYYWPRSPSPMFVYTYEMNEGYDTDNDGVSDKDELSDSRNQMASPQDHDDPIRRQALWFSGTNAAASSVMRFAYDDIENPELGDIYNGFRSFTVELWARPAATNRNQVLIERSFMYGPSDNSTSNSYLRRNYRIGIEDDGRVYATFENAGTHDSHTDSVRAYGHKLLPNKWVHVVARMDGLAQKFTLFVNSEPQAIVETDLIPANGIIISRDYPSDQTHYLNQRLGNLVLGAANNAPIGLTLDLAGNWHWPQTWADFDQFYQGWIDEVRIWDGARDDDTIKSDYKKRFTHEDLMANRVLVVGQVARGYAREASNPQQLTPVLMHHYTFDNLFGSELSDYAVTSPRGFNDDQVSVNRPIWPLAEVPWWSETEVKSTVYNDYNYMPWIENGYDHLPLFGGVNTDVATNAWNALLLTNKVYNSVYWAHVAAGSAGATNLFPNRCNPYGLLYHTRGEMPSGATLVAGGLMFNRDLLPLGDAFAKRVTDMWDLQGAADAWLETGRGANGDLDSDGLPAWWMHSATNRLSQLVPPVIVRFEDVKWFELYPDGQFMTYGERYQRDVARGASPEHPEGASEWRMTADSDSDGLPDWWEKLFNLNPSGADGAKGRDGAGGDPDRDGLSNLAEYQISEVYTAFNLFVSPLLIKTNPFRSESDYYTKPEGAKLTLGAMFADHDFMEDAWEDLYHPYYVNRFVYEPHIDNDEDGWSNWSECRYEKNSLKSDPSLGMHLDPEGTSSKDFPVPVIETRLTYNGLNPIAPVVIHAFSNPEMDGLPDAVYTLPVAAGGATVGTAKTKTLGFWGARVIRGFLSPGTLVPASLRMTFTDVINGYTAIVGRDTLSDISGRTGTIIGEVGGWAEKIGTINYITGEYEIDLTWFTGAEIPVVVSPTYTALILASRSYVKINYRASQVDGWPKTVYLTDADATGDYIREGLNYFFAFMDLNADGQWQAGEPCGVPQDFETDINWERNKICIELTDYLPNHLRMTLQPGLRSDDVYLGTGGQTVGGGTPATGGLLTRVRVRRSRIDGLQTYQFVILDRVLNVRSYLHEGDFLSQGKLGLDWNFTNVVRSSVSLDMAVYDVFVGDAPVLTNNVRALTFTNWFDSVQAKAESVAPINGTYVYSARPVFRWKMPDGYTAFALELRKGATTVYRTGETQAPIRDMMTDEYVWEAPIHVGNRLGGQILTSNTIYSWRVIALNPKFTLGVTGGNDANWSGWKQYRWDVNSPMVSSGYGEIRAAVKYYGPAVSLSGKVKVQVYNNRGFTGVPVAEYTLTDAQLNSLTSLAPATTNAIMRGLAPSSTAGDYTMRAYIDSNANGRRDVWESWGYANYYGLTDTPNDARRFDVSFSMQSLTASITIEDADTDQDWFPDAWEYEKNPGSSDFLALTGPSSSWDGVGNTEVNPDLLTGGAWQGVSLMSALALGTTDQDGDGLGDLAELILGSDALSASTSGDGFSDGEKASLGLAPGDVLALTVTGIDVAASGADVQWRLAVQKTDPAKSALLSALMGGTSTGDVQYYIDATPTLVNPAWETVATGTVSLEGTQTLLKQVRSTAAKPAASFFRVRLGK